MARYYGNIGFYLLQVESRPGVWEDVIEERPYKGDVLHSGRRWESTDNINDDVVLTNRFSIVSDTYLNAHVPALRYLEYLGTKFKITSVELEPPRVIISVGGVYVPGDSEAQTSDGAGGNSGE